MNEIIDLPTDSESLEHWCTVMKLLFSLSEKSEKNGIEFIRKKISSKHRSVDFEKSHSIFSDSENQILFEMLALLCDKSPAVLISRVIEKRVEQPPLTESEKIALYLALEAVFCIQNKVSQQTMKEKFRAMLDETCIEAIGRSFFEKTDSAPILPQVQGSAFRSFEFKDCHLLSNSAIKNILKEIDPMDLSKALKLSDARTKGKFFYNMSKTSSEILQDDIETLPATRAEIRIKQHHIENLLSYLQLQGRIFIPLVCAVDEISSLLIDL